MQRIVYLVLFLLFGGIVSATHNRAGEITYRHLSGLTYEITIITYTYTPSPADRPSLNVNWGDNTSSIVNRTQKINLPNDISKNTYVGTHTFLGQGTFVISMEDPNRNGGVINIINSINEAFFIQSVLTINPFLGFNNSPILLNPPIDIGCVGAPFYHNPSAYDPDGDSLSYSLIPCRGENGQNINTFSNPLASIYYGIDPITGTLTWNTPTIQGEFNIAIKITEWRNGIEIGHVVRDMQVDISNCNNHPPVIGTLIDTCIEVGSNLNFWVKATDVDNHIVTLTATGGPLILSSNPASFPQPTSGYKIDSSFFNWTPNCLQVKKQAYQINFKAIDNGSPINLVDYEEIKIKVIGPSPKNPLAIPKGNHIEISWSKNACANVVRYDIYRHNGYIGYIPSYCETGVPAWTGYVKIGSTNSIGDTTYKDDGNGFGLIHGPDYCYMIVAVYPDSAESYASLETCATLIRDLPVITHVSIDSTSKTSGIVKTIWAKPTEINFSQTPGPFKYMIYHKNQNATNFTLIDSISGLNDTIYIFKNINTEDESHAFKIDLLQDNLSNRFVLGSTQKAESIFLNASPGDNQITLNWKEVVPWNNYKYLIYRKNIVGVFDSIGFSSTTSFIDTGLVNGVTYCYQITSIGEYTSSQFTKPLINYSQEICSIPIDKVPPCPPIVSIKTDCRLIQNTIVWDNPNNRCANDVVAYKLYYRPSGSGDFTEIFSTNNLSDTSFIHTGLKNIVACYSVVAIDSFNNTSAFSVPVCIDVDSCELYRLPNVFTPNGDGINEYYHPYPYDFVESIEIQIFSRWGNMVFSSTDPDINWDGKDMSSKQDCSDGVYFFVCHVSEYTLEGLKKRDIRGSITIIR